MGRKFLGISALVVASGLIGISRPAQANDVLNYLQQYFGGVSTSTNYAEATRMSELDAKRQMIDARISDALSSGRLMPAEAATLHAQLRSNANMELQLASDGRFSFADNQSISANLDNIDARLSDSIQSIPYNPSYSIVAPRELVARRQVDALQVKLADRIERGRAHGRLTPMEYRMLKRELTSINARKLQMTRNDGFLSRFENQRLLSRLNRLEIQIRNEINDSQVAGRFNARWH